MKIDLDPLMRQNEIDAILVTGPAQHNPAMTYLTGGGHITQADLIKKAGEPAVLYHGMMERDEAAKTGLIARSYGVYSWTDLLKEANGDAFLAGVLRYQRMLQDAGITRGRVALFGQVELGKGFSTFHALQQRMPGLSFDGHLRDDIFLQAMATKDSNEIARIRQMGQVTVEVVGRTAEFLGKSGLRGDILVAADGEPLTIGKVKGLINLWLAELGAENPEGTIFAIGRDAGVPHSSGTNSDLLRLGQTIVYDIFPCEAGGGYYYDFTRTWCLGYAPDEALKLYEQVLSVYHQVVSELKLNMLFSIAQRRTCELFESMGHPTVLNTPETESGYIHSVGHGLGLHVHERPFSGSASKDYVMPGSVFTIEPGLYYPERGMGVRLEDTYYAAPDGVMVPLAEYPMDLVIPVSR
ncbi:MAG TPA: M24 family metallopeptidase [Anaerolineaceae bacterium]|nr:M24 family metallopeptidase [Anaerolineaceae bacterium]